MTILALEHKSLYNNTKTREKEKKDDDGDDDDEDDDDTKSCNYEV